MRWRRVEKLPAMRVMGVMRGLEGQLLVHERGFDGPETAHPPIGRGQFLDHVHFDWVLRVERLNVVVKKVGKRVLRLVPEDGVLG